MIHPIYINTKARAGDSALITRLIAENIKAVLIVEPEEKEIYSATYPKMQIAVLPENGRGLPFSRQFALELARRHKNEWFWIIDDDIKQFYKVRDARCVPIAAREALEGVQALAEQTGAAQAALEYNQFAWSSTKPFVENSYCDCVVLFNLQRTAGANFRTDIKLKGDREFTIQLLAAGNRVIRAQQFAFSAPKNGSNKGGLAEIYATAGEEKLASETLVRLYGTELCQLNIKPDGRPDVKINWRKFRQTRI